MPGRGSREAEGCGTGQKPRVLPSAPVLSRRHDLHAGRREGRHAACSDARGAGAASSAPAGAGAAGRRAARQPCGGRVLPRYFIRARLRCAPAPVQDAPCQAEQPDGQPPGRQLDRAAQLAHGRGDALRRVWLRAWTSTCAGAGLSARKAGRLSAARGALGYTQVLCRSSRRAGLRRPASAHAYAAQSPRDSYDRQPRRSP